MYEILTCHPVAVHRQCTLPRNRTERPLTPETIYTELHREAILEHPAEQTCNYCRNLRRTMQCRFNQRIAT